MNTIELTPVNRKSFYGKAVMIDNGDTVELLSYQTKVAEFNKRTNKATVKGWYSSTTARHINAFLHNFGLERMTKQEMEN